MTSRRPILVLSCWVLCLEEFARYRRFTNVVYMTDPSQQSGIIDLDSANENDVLELSNRKRKSSGPANRPSKLQTRRASSSNRIRKVSFVCVCSALAPSLL